MPELMMGIHDIVPLHRAHFCPSKKYSIFFFSFPDFCALYFASNRSRVCVMIVDGDKSFIKLPLAQ